jgi:fructoselysine-6-P-deglycase FrlB-like protein
MTDIRRHINLVAEAATDLHGLRQLFARLSTELSNTDIHVEFNVGAGGSELEMRYVMQHGNVHLSLLTAIAARVEEVIQAQGGMAMGPYVRSPETLQWQLKFRSA